MCSTCKYTAEHAENDSIATRSGHAPSAAQGACGDRRSFALGFPGAGGPQDRGAADAGGDGRAVAAAGALPREALPDPRPARGARSQLIVLDASAAVELVLQTSRAERVAARALHPAQRIHAPHLIDIEVAQVLRRLVCAKELTPARAGLALSDFADLVLQRHPHRPFISRIWGLRTSMSAYDAAYVALAEALGAPMLTCDEKLARVHGHSVEIELIPIAA